MMRVHWVPAEPDGTTLLAKFPGARRFHMQIHVHQITTADKLSPHLLPELLRKGAVTALPQRVA
jgi:hypothetical protein